MGPINRSVKFVFLAGLLLMREYQLNPHSTLVVCNNTSNNADVNIVFGSDSVITENNWLKLCTKPITQFHCSFPLIGSTCQFLSLNDGSYINATVAFNSWPTCNTTVAEFTLNSPNNYDVVDISLVNGYSNDISIDLVTNQHSFVTKEVDGKYWGELLKGSLTLENTGNNNETAFGVYPNGCDGCAIRIKPPCDNFDSNDGCKKGTQFNPAVPCQYQLITGSKVVISLVK